MSVLIRNVELEEFAYLLDLAEVRLNKYGEPIEFSELVQCKDCKYKVVTDDGEYNPEDIVCNYWDSDGLSENDYCSYGERKDDE